MIRFNPTCTVLGALLLVGCSTTSESDESVSVESQLTANGMSAEVAVTSDWGTGYCADVKLVNVGSTTITSWTVDINLGGATLANLWSATAVTNATALHVTPVAFNTTLALKGSTTFGFCASGTARPTVTAITTTGGTSGTGGASSTGGTSAKGGASSTGGTSAKGGSSSTGGTSAKGGSSSVATTPVTVWMAGDSTMQNCSSACPCGWGSQFANYVNSYVTVKNNAAGGRSIQTWMYEPNVSATMGSSGECVTVETNSSRWATTLSGMKAGDYLFIQFGINDGASTCNRHVGTARYQTLMTRMAKAALDKGAHPILVTAVSAISCSGSTAKATRGFLTETKAAAQALGIPVIDLHQLSINLYNSLKFCPLPSGNTDVTATTGGAVGTFFCDDHTHFDTTGAYQIAGVVAKALKTQSIALGSYLK